MNKPFQLFSATVIVGLLLMGCDSVAPTGSDVVDADPALHSHGTTVNVTAEDMNNWEAWVGSTGTYAFVSDAGAPAGQGALELSLGSSAEKVYLFNDSDFAGTPLSSVDDFSFWTKSNVTPQAPAFQFRICRFETPEVCGFSTLNVEPYHFGTVVTDTWQQWHLSDAKVWGSGIPVDSPGGHNNPISWDDFNALYPNAAILGLAVNAGAGWPGGFTGRFDALAIVVDGARTFYDFGPTPANPAAKEDCMNGGWEAFGFRNQGQCIQFVNTGKDSR